MRTASVLSRIRIATLSLAALATAAVARLLDQGEAKDAEPRIAPPPAGARPASFADAQVQILAAVELQIETISADLSGLRLALQAMSPLPDQDLFFIPAEPARHLDHVEDVRGAAWEAGSIAA